MPLSILKVAKALYGLVDIRTDLRLRQDYRNVAGFVLPSGHPGNPFFGRELRSSESEHIVSREIHLSPDFEPERVARELAEEVYTYFGYGAKEIPRLEDVMVQESEPV